MLPDALFWKVHMYGIMVALGVLAAFGVLYLYSKKMKIDLSFTDFLFYDGIVSVLLGFGCAALFQGVYNYIENPAAGFSLKGGITFLGGMLGGAAVFIGVVGRSVAGLDYLSNNDAENIFIDAATSYLPPILAGFACAGVLAAAISSSDSYLLISASAVSQNLYRGVFKKDATEKQVMWCSRITLVLITIVAMAIAWNSNSTIFGITSFAWAGFGAAFGPLMLLCLFWKRTTYQGAIAGMVAGGAMVFFWKLVLKPLGGMFGIYELLPAFVFSVIVIVAVSLLTAEPDAQIEAEFDKVKAGKGLQ